MKLHHPGEARVRRQKAREGLGLEEPAELVEFDPHRDIPEEIRERYIIHLNLRPMRGLAWQPAMDLAMYLALFPEEREKLLDQDTIHSQMETVGTDLGIALLFPDQTENIRKRRHTELLETFEKTRDKFSRSGPIGRVKACVLLRLIFPSEAANEQTFFDEAWTSAKLATTQTRSIEDRSIFLAWTRLAMPDRFEEVAPSAEDWKEMKIALQNSFKEDLDRRQPKSLRFAFSLYILAAEEVAVVPGVGIKVQSAKRRLGATPNLPDRPQV